MSNQEQGQSNAMDDGPVQIANAQIDDELKTINPLRAMDATPLSVPVEVLGDRAFELLTFRLFQEGQGTKAKTQCGLGVVHDSTWLMQGTADKGRDVVLLRKGAAVGVVQCKHYASDYTLPQTLKEVCRFILATKKYPAMLPSPEDFTYVLVLSRKANGKAASLFQETARVLQDSPKLLPKVVTEALTEFKELSTLDPVESLAYAQDILGKIQLRLLQGIDLAIWLHSSEEVFSTFFQARFVVDKAEVLERLEQIKNALNGNFSADALDQTREMSALAIARADDQSGTQRLVMLSEVYIPRTIEAQVDLWIEKADYTIGEGVLIAVIAPAGFGKTSLLWGCHRRWSERTDVVTLALAATQLATLILNAGFDKVRQALLNHAANLREVGLRFVVYLDTFDVLMHREDLSQPALKFIRELVENGVSLIVSSRPEEVVDLNFDHLAPHSVQLYLSEYDTHEFADALRSYCAAFYPGADAQAQATMYAERLAELVALGRPAREVCLNPLALRMLFELYAPAEVPENINSSLLYLRYLKERVQGDRRAGAPKSTAKGKDLSQATKQVALAMFSQQVPSLTDRQFDQLVTHQGVDENDLRELVSRHLLRRTAGRVEFFHQTFFEYIAGLALAEQSRYSPGSCETDLLNHADDSFEFPIREHQLWHCAHWLLQNSAEMDLTLGNLLSQHHPGPWSAALRLHLMAEIGYGSARAYILNEAQNGIADVLKRYCQLIHHLALSRANEVHELILASRHYQTWEVVQWTSQLMIWLAPIDWPVCRRLVEEHDLIGELIKVAIHSGNVAQVVTDILRGGLNTDPTYVLETAVRCLYIVRERDTTLEFLAQCAETINEEQARFLAQELLSWARAESPAKIGPLLSSAERCLSTLWSRYPTLCNLRGDSASLVESTELRLSLRALNSNNNAALDSVRIGFLRRLALDLSAGALNVLLHKFVVRLVHSSHTAPSLQSLANHQCERLIVDLNSPTQMGQPIDLEKAKVIYNFVRRLKELKCCPKAVDEIIAKIPCQQWLDAQYLTRLLPIAVAEEVGGAMQAIQIILNSPQKFPRHLAVLRAALPTMLQTPAQLDIALRLAIADQSSQLAFASLKKMIESGNWQSLRPVALRHAVGLQQFCLTAAGGALIEERKSAYILLELLVRQNLIEKIDYPQMLHWTQKETRHRTRAQAAAHVLLTACTTTENGEQTIRELLDAALGQTEGAKNHLTHRLQQTLTIKGLRLSNPILEELVDFALQPSATQSQVSLVGRVMNIYYFQNDILRADQAALRLLRSPSLHRLSSMQKRRLCHHLDKSFQYLYRQLSESELQLHLQELRQLDPLLGRVVVVALCKSGRPNRDGWARKLTSDETIHRSLRTIVHDYRQHRWVSTAAT